MTALADTRRENPPPGPMALTAAQSRRVDELALARLQLTTLELMERAGRRCAEWIRLNVACQRAVILCGTGNNGGDSLVIARLLHEAGVNVNVVLFGSRDRLSPDAAINLGRWLSRPAGSPIVFASELTPDGFARDLARLLKPSADLEAAVIIDAVFGTGFKPARAIVGPFTQLKPAIAGADPRPTVIAIDVPSGMDADTGQADAATLPADHTLTFVAPKAGLLTRAAAGLAGGVHVIDLGLPIWLVAEAQRSDRADAESAVEDGTPGGD